MLIRPKSMLNFHLFKQKLSLSLLAKEVNDKEIYLITPNFKEQYFNGMLHAGS